MTVKVQCSHRQLSALFPPLTFPAGVGVLHQRPRAGHLAQTPSALFRRLTFRRPLCHSLVRSDYLCS